MCGRTLPRVRELKPYFGQKSANAAARRTLPRVRELKRFTEGVGNTARLVAPFPGCVN